MTQARKILSAMLPFVSAPPAEAGEDQDRYAARIRSLATLVTAVAGLVVAVSALYKPRDDRATQQSYETLVHEIRDLNDDVMREHEDLVALRAFVTGLDKSRTDGDSIPDDASAPASVPVSAPTSVPSSAPVSVAPKATKAPTISPRPKPASPPSFAKVKASADSLP